MKVTLFRFVLFFVFGFIIIWGMLTIYDSVAYQTHSATTEIMASDANTFVASAGQAAVFTLGSVNDFSISCDGLVIDQATRLEAPQLGTGHNYSMVVSCSQLSVVSGYPLVRVDQEVSVQSESILNVVVAFLMGLVALLINGLICFTPYRVKRN